MKPHQKLAETKTPTGAVLGLYEHDGVYTIRLSGQALMDSSTHAAETLAGEWVGRKLSTHGSAKVLVGGLGFGFALKSVLQKAGPKTSIHVLEPNPTIVAWNREFLPALNGELLKDPRVKVGEDNISEVILRASPGRYDAILVANEKGPLATGQNPKSFLSNLDGIQALSTALKVGGRAVIWSTSEDRVLSEWLVKSGLSVEVVPAKLYPTAKRFGATIYVADKGSEIQGGKTRK